MKYLEPILVFVVAVLSLIISLNKWSKLTNTHRLIVVSIIAFLLIIAIVQITNIATDKVEKDKENEKQSLVEKINAKFGDLNFDGEPVKQMRIGKREDGATLDLVDGVLSLSSFGQLFPSSSGQLLKLAIKDNRLLVYTIIRDGNGDVVAVIDGDTWTVFDDGYEYNDDNGKAFELVTKGDRRVFFQIEYKNNLVEISGFLLNADGEGLHIYDTGIGDYGAAMNPVVKSNYENRLKEYEIPRIFKYPRGKYFGVRQ
ncbi:hypothetical protein H8K90_11525 [Winogradskyella echinorum]|uniref:Uncharacterized protein n=1 Tax=Winogradskyella echinorum TaxID=538189 RepID=A0ABR6Y2Q1_9FLAO|nr:hypothetical protein [Winogradskyella echinorum]MBC3847013.1 hypothetical protein [Winogradskyella echinorum]MBC5751361.1 hypothetical protein [Winogradskyella echinorum]